MRKNDCLRWAKALINGKHEKLRGRMSNSRNSEEKPSAMCCLGVANEEFKVNGYERDRMDGAAFSLSKAKVLSRSNPEVFGLSCYTLNDGRKRLMGEEGFTHEQIGILLLFAIESGEYKNI
jgi:hypothetical protein